MVPAEKSPSTKKPSRSTNRASPPEAQPDQAVRADTQGQTPPEREELMLPKGALIAMRTSGGARPEAREVVVYPDGRITYDAHEKPDMRRPRTLTDARIAEIRHTLERINFLRLPSTEGTPSAEGTPSTEGKPSGNRVQIAARIGARTNSVKYSKENLPVALAPLHEQLSALLPQEHRDQTSETPNKP
jgi:hypothetical protein